MNVGELLKERNRLLDVIEEAKIAKSRIRQLNVLIAMYGDDENVSLVTDVEMVDCPKCGKSVKVRGLHVHNRRMHGKMTAAQRSKAAKNASQARILRRVS